ncbi:NFX1-type zinc finger-containing protein 1 [Clohesyomyces aquaticus]|uniref:NFX1-type zinc finger-containing protein 1 n=1 Tax=Clohesyomyces aquaticus TaxID=1231657 RepID=A0A1Y1ZC76_9PLEO|nr:NFX1-type zinc finger-containing protein 1 [Clohesyomyces aquaticus]
MFLRRSWYFWFQSDCTVSGWGVLGAERDIESRTFLGSSRGCEKPSSNRHPMEAIKPTTQGNIDAYYGSTCKFSHNLSSDGDGHHQRDKPPRPEETPEQQRAKSDYNAWRRTIKYLPQQNDERTIEQLWSGALDILNGDDREWQQMLARDLDSDDYHGREHIKTLLTLRSRPGKGETFIRLAGYFLSVITHGSLLDCLSVDTAVGALYNFISGTNGTRAISFFQHICEILANSHLNSHIQSTAIESTLQAMLVALRELLRREPRARFNEELTSLIDAMENTVQIVVGDTRNLLSPIALRQIREIRAIVARANGLLAQEGNEKEFSPDTVAKPSYPRNMVMPRDRHDNDKADITKIKIFPTTQEIMSDAIDFLPSTDLDQPHFLENKVERHIDTCFRLYRHDNFGDLKAALGCLMNAIEADPASLNNPRLNLGDFRAFHFPQAYISYVSFDQRRGLEMNISFQQLPNLRKKSAQDRRKWSTDARHDFSLTKDDYQCTITAKLVYHDQMNVSSAARLSCGKVKGILLEFPGVIPATFVPILENLQNMQKLSRLPFSQWILPDRIDTTLHGTRGHFLNIPSPLYTRQPGFTFRLNSILKPEEVDNRNISVSPTSSPNDESLVGLIEAHTGLDRGQSQALIAALTREFAFIQGPPGTGKSYLGVQLMKVLMDCKKSARLGPIIVVCYTNHALDQFLEHLIQIGIQKIIRIGGQSKSTILEELNLRKVSQPESKTKSENYLLHTSYQALEEESKKIKSNLGRLHGTAKRPNWKTLEYHLRSRYRQIHRQFRDTDDEGFKVAGRHPFDTWMPAGSSDVKLTTAQAKIVLEKARDNVNDLAQEERHALVNFWTQEICDFALDDLYERVRTTDSTQKQLVDIHDEVDRRVLQAADVVGITTTGLAKRISTLQRVRCKVVVCEEAGEVMEPHMISALLPFAEHVIQIGDHEQLRPQINNYGLSLESKQGGLYQLDRSQFERLSVGEAGRPRIPVAQLNVQRRMRPEISTLIRQTIYPRLVDHGTTIDLPDVVGMQKNMYWLDHDHLEVGQNSEMHHKSHSNLWEVEMVHALVRHIIRQGVYSSCDIAVLTPYTGQLQKLRSAMRSDFEIVLSDRDQDALEKDGFAGGSSADEASLSNSNYRKTALEKKKLSDLLRVATVDNFQGEEAKVVIVSLVRSNNGKKVGFLRTTNRINVLLSRAQHGMYLIGNSDTYSNVDMWQKVINMLRAADSIGNRLRLCCPRHPDTEIEVNEPGDFSKLSPEGGCRLACLWRLPDCGHMCQARCHSESMHNVFLCPQPCQRLHDPCKHACQKATCGEDCGKCHIKLSNVPLPCGHFKDDVYCFQAQNPSAIPCSVLVQKSVPGCKHVVNVACSVDVAVERYRCPTPCPTTLSCGHPCPGTCSSCSRKDDTGQVVTSHKDCTKQCGRPFGTCNHTCRKRCHGKDCGPCVSPCEVRCQHSKCTLSCHEACAPCVEKCTWECEHRGACTMPCSAPCNRLPCDQRCTKELACGHMCPGICGEICPNDCCHKCGNKQDARVDLYEMKTYAEIDVNESPIVVLGCGHFFTAETLDGHVGLNEVYTTNRVGEFNGLADINSTLATQIPRCPDCQRPIRQYVTQRYNRLINRAVMDEMSKRFLVSGKDELRGLEIQVDELEHDLEKSGNELRKTIPRAASNAALGTMVMADLRKRYHQPKELQKKLKDFLKKVAGRHQPTHKLYEAIVHSKRTSKAKDPGSIEDALVSLTIQDNTVPSVERDRRITLGGRMVQIKADCILLEDKFDISEALKAAFSAKTAELPGGSPGSHTEQFLKTCATFIADCSVESLPKLAVEASIYFATIARLYRSSGLSDEDQNKATGFVDEAKELLEKAQDLCKQPFQNAEQLGKAVEENIKLLRREWYEKVTEEELAEIKKAMLSGPKGIATHSGHWYNCANGHPFAIGECGMPMQQARCPECGAPIGGLQHQAVEGVTRATNMEG